MTQRTDEELRDIIKRGQKEYRIRGIDGNPTNKDQIEIRNKKPQSFLKKYSPIISGIVVVLFITIVIIGS